MVSSLRYLIESCWSARLLKTSLSEYNSREVKHFFLNFSAYRIVLVNDEMLLAVEYDGDGDSD